MKTTEDFEEFIKKNFLPLWTDFLHFEIQRSLECIKFMGSPNAYIIMQIIAWNQHLSIISKSKYLNRDDVRQKWFEESKSESVDRMKLSYSLVAQLSGLSVETIRRHVKKMIAEGWVRYNKKEGILFRANEENMKKLADELNVKEVNLLSRFFTRIEKLKK
tara:strand:+ start:136 stop:618 length:483 start_codon:yes stop_codon:yes gene_type:complete